MQDVAAERLHIGHGKVGAVRTVDDNIARVVLLATRLGVERRAVEDDAEGRAVGDF